jgi:hypothetical protein
MLKIIGRIMAILLVAGALTAVTNVVVGNDTTGSRFGADREEHGRDDETFAPNSLSARYPALGVVGGLLPTVLKLGALGVATVQVGNLAKRLRRNRPPAQHAA